MVEQSERAAYGGGVPWIVPALLMMASATSILATDLYTPSLPHLTGYFSTDDNMVQLTMSLNVLGFAFAQLIYGPLADRIGRRPVMLGGMAGFILFSLACALSQTIEFLIVARVLQGMTACAEAVVALLVIRDLYDEEDSVRMMGIYGMTISLAPAVGPIIGGYVHVWLGWQANFYLLTGMALLVTGLIVVHLPETGQKIRGAARPGRILRDYGALLANRSYLSYTLTCTAIMGGLFAYIAGAPFVLQNLMDVPISEFGYYHAAVVVAYFFASMTANKSVGRLGVENLLKLGLVLVLAGGAMLPVLDRLGVLTPVLVALAMGVFAFGLGLVFATGPIRALDSANTGKGPAAALLGSIEMAGAGLGALTISWLYDGTSWPLSIAVGGYGVAAVLFYLLLVPRRNA